MEANIRKKRQIEKATEFAKNKNKESTKENKSGIKKYSE